MKTNIGTIDKLFRLVLSIIFVILYLTNLVSGVFGIILLAFAGIFILTSLAKRCPLYVPLGIKTIKTEPIQKP